MDYASIIPYFAAVAALTAAPGPLMAVLVVRSLERDSSGAAAFATGLQRFLHILDRGLDLLGDIP